MDNNLEESQSLTGSIRDEQGKFVPGVSGNPLGRPPETQEDKIAKKAIKELVSDYKEKLAESLIKLEPILVAEGLKGNIQAIKEINDRVMGKPEQTTDITSGGKPIPIYVSGNNGVKEDIEVKPEG